MSPLMLALLVSANGVSAASIDHRPVGCVVADELPRFEARLTPPDAVRRARVSFRADATSTWYAVAMKPEGVVFAAALPKPQKGLCKFPFPWNMDGSLDGGNARFVVYGGTQCILSLTLSGDRLSGSMSACNESPGMTQDVVLRRTGK